MIREVSMRPLEIAGSNKLNSLLSSYRFQVAVLERSLHFLCDFVASFKQFGVTTSLVLSECIDNSIILNPLLISLLHALDCVLELLITLHCEHILNELGEFLGVKLLTQLQPAFSDEYPNPFVRHSVVLLCGSIVSLLILKALVGIPMINELANFIGLAFKELFLE